MSYLNKVVYLSEEQKNTLFANNTITVNGTTVTYDSDDLYIVPDEIDTSPTENSTNLVTSGGVYNAIHNYTPLLATKATAANLPTTTNAIAKYRDANGTFANSSILIDTNNHLKPGAHDSSKLGAVAQGWKELDLAAQKSGLDNGIRFTNGTTTLGHIGGNTEGGLAFIGGTTTSTIYFEPNPSNLSIGIEVKSDKTIVPRANGDHELGSTAASWKNLYLSVQGATQGLFFTDGTNLKGSIFHGDNLSFNTNGNIYLRPAIANIGTPINGAAPGIVIKNTDTQIQTEGILTLQKNSTSTKSVSLVFNETTNALNFVFV